MENRKKILIALGSFKDVFNPIESKMIGILGDLLRKRKLFRKTNDKLIKSRMKGDGDDETKYLGILEPLFNLITLTT